MCEVVEEIEEKDVQPGGCSTSLREDRRAATMTGRKTIGNALDNRHTCIHARLQPFTAQWDGQISFQAQKLR